jgi:hypothetical protein
MGLLAPTRPIGVTMMIVILTALIIGCVLIGGPVPARPAPGGQGPST